MFVLTAFLTVVIFVAKVVISGVLVVCAAIGAVCIKEQIVGIVRLHREEQRQNAETDDEFEEWLDEHRMLHEAREERALPALEPANPRR